MKPHLFQLGSFTLSSGLPSGFKIECDALADDDWFAAAHLLAQRVPIFSTVIGIPTGGTKLAWELRRYREPRSTTNTVLLADDVYTTGRSIHDARKRLWVEDETIMVYGAVLFARGPTPDWVTPLFTMGRPPP